MSTENEQALLARVRAAEQENEAAEEYAGRMENALGHIRFVCKLTLASEAEGTGWMEALDLVLHLAMVKDKRGAKAIPF